MDALSNPFTAGPGLRPYTLAGRESFLQTVGVATARLVRGRPPESLLLVGLHGVGKTVLLSQMREDAATASIQAIFLEAAVRRSLPSLLAPEFRLMLLRLSRIEKAKDTSVRALRALAGFANALRDRYPDLEVGFDHEPESGLADSGVLEQDLLALFESLGAAAQHAQTAVVLFIDDLHCLPAAEWSALTMTLHRCAQRNLPIALVGTGLPQLRSHTKEIGSFADRIFEFHELGPLSTEAAAQAVRAPAAALDVIFEQGAVSNILAASQCHPYYLQELAKQAWDIAPQSPVTLQDTRNAAHFALAALDEKFFRVRVDCLTPTERRYIRAMAELGPGPHRSGEIAAVLNRPVTSVGPARSQLIAKGVLWSPGHGDTAFAVPRFDEYMRRTWPGSSWRN